MKVTLIITLLVASVAVLAVTDGGQKAEAKDTKIIAYMNNGQVAYEQPEYDEEETIVEGHLKLLSQSLGKSL